MGIRGVRFIRFIRFGSYDSGCTVRTVHDLGFGDSGSGVRVWGFGFGSKDLVRGFGFRLHDPPSPLFFAPNDRSRFLPRREIEREIERERERERERKRERKSERGRERERGLGFRISSLG